MREKSVRKRKTGLLTLGRKKENQKATLPPGVRTKIHPHTHTYQRDNGTLGCELCGAEQRPDKTVDLLLLRVVFFIIRRNFRLLQHKENTQNENE